MPPMNSADEVDRLPVCCTCSRPVVAFFCRADRANQYPKSGGERTQRGHSRFRSVRDRTNLISYIDASSLDGLAVQQPRGHWRHTPSPAQSPSR